ncbi:hypothetical protein Hte_010507 [Hypoxylon texense]
MQYTMLFLSVLGLSVLCASAPADNSATSTETASNNNTISDAESNAAAPPKEDDADDEFVYQWRH